MEDEKDPTASAENERESEIASQASAEPTADAGGEATPAPNSGASTDAGD